MSGARLLAVVPPLMLVLAAFAARSAPVPAARDTLPVSPVRDRAPLSRLDGASYVAANDLARLLDAVRFWRADVRKLVLRAGRHRITLTVDNPFVVVDQRTLALPAPVRMVAGEVQVPAALVDSLPRDSTLARLLVDPRGNRVLVLPEGGVVRGPLTEVQDSLTRWIFSTERPEDVVVASRGRERFRVRFSGYYAGSLPDPIPEASLVRGARPIGSVSGSALELRVAPEAMGFRLLRDLAGRRVVLEFWGAPRPDLEAFAPEVRPAPGGVRVVVLDAGHGGNDAGVRAGGAAEKDLTLLLAQLLRGELQRRGLTHVLLTRSDDRTVGMQARAELANHARADLYLSLHLDGFASRAARGITIVCPPAVYGANLPTGAPRLARIAVLPWRDVAERHAVQSLALAEVLRSRLELHGLGPVRLREVLPVTLVGVDAAALMIECGMLTSPEERARLTDPERLGELARHLADGIAAWERSE